MSLTASTKINQISWLSIVKSGVSFCRLKMNLYCKQNQSVHFMFSLLIYSFFFFLKKKQIPLFEGPTPLFTSSRVIGLKSPMSQ